MENAKLRAQLAAKDKEIEELTQQLLKANVKANVKAGPMIVGLYGNDTGTIVRAVNEGTGKGAEKSYFTYNRIKKYLKSDDADNWVFMEEEAVLAAVAAHDEKMNNLKKSSPAK